MNAAVLSNLFLQRPGGSQFFYAVLYIRFRNSREPEGNCFRRELFLIGMRHGIDDDPLFICFFNQLFFTEKLTERPVKSAARNFLRESLRIVPARAARPLIIPLFFSGTAFSFC